MFGFSKAKKPDVLSHYYAPLTGKELLLISLFVFPGFAHAQQGANLTDDFAATDAQHDAAYSQALPKLTSQEQEQLIRAELAWADFSEKEKTFVNALQSENRVSQEFVHSHSIAVEEARTDHIKAFFVDLNINYPPQYTPHNRDQELNKTYTECFRLITESDKALLVATERAWIVYRDADVAAAAAGNDNTIWTNADIVHLTMMRTEQIASIVDALRQVLPAHNPMQELPPASPGNFPAPEDIKALADFQKDARVVLQAFLAKKDTAFFKNADVLKNAPELPAEVSDHISRLDAQYDALSSKPNFDKLFEPVLNESAAVKLLDSWSRFTGQLKAGNVDDAGSAIQEALSHKPKDSTADYLPIWQVVESWQKVYLNDAPQFHDHIQKAQSFADLGKSSAAIKEYQAAYDIFEVSTIQEKIKKLREQSLGL